MLSVCPTSHSMPSAVSKNSAARFGSLNANATDSVTFGNGSSYTPFGTKQAFALLVSLFLGIAGLVIQKNQRLNNEEAHQKELNIAVSKLSNATHGGIKGSE